MIGLFRKFLNTRAARIFFVVLVVPFVLWGVADVARNAGGSTALATVGDRKIEPQEFQGLFRQQLAGVTRRMGGNAEPPPEVRRDVAAQTLDQLITRAALANAVASLRLAVPDASLRQAVFDMPEFRGAAGTFDKRQFESVLRQNNLSEGRFLELMRASVAERQLMEAVGAGAASPTTLVDQVFGFQHETRTAETVDLPLTAAADPAEPSEAQLRTAYADDPSRYGAPAFRHVKLVVLAPETVAKGIEVPDADIAAFHAEHKAEFGGPEKRSVQVLVAPTEAVAAALAAQWKAGADWAAMQKAATEAGATAAALDDATPDGLPGTDLAEAAFVASPDTVTGPVKTEFGVDVLKVVKVTPADEKPLDAVRDEIKGRIARQKATEDIYNRSARLEDVLAAGNGFDEIPADLGAAVQGGTMDAKGNTKEGEPAPIPGSAALRQAILAAAFKAPLNQVPQLVEGPEQSFYALSVDGETPPEVRPFEAVQDQVRENWLRDSRRRAQEMVAAKLLAEVKGGKSLDDAATEAGLRAETSAPITRGAQAEGLAPAVSAAVFALPLHDVTMVETPEGFVVVRLAEIASPPPASDPVMLAQLRTVLDGALGQDMDAVFANALRGRAQPTVNRSMLESLVQ